MKYLFWIIWAFYTVGFLEISVCTPGSVAYAFVANDSLSASETSLQKITLCSPSLALPQSWPRDCVTSDCCVRVEQDARVSGFIE